MTDLSPDPLVLTQLVDGSQAEETLTLPFEIRKKSRFRASLDSGKPCAVILPRGTSLRDGQLLQSDDGQRVLVNAAVEKLSSVTTPDSLKLTKAAYHLGNRHVALQIVDGNLRYLHDHVLDDMVREMGLGVASVEAPFQPESGAYGRHGGHGHHHDH